MTPPRIGTVALLVCAALVAGIPSPRAELSPETYKAMQDAAPEMWEITVLSVEHSTAARPYKSPWEGCVENDDRLDDGR
jgi:hypothetical protein